MSVTTEVTASAAAHIPAELSQFEGLSLSQMATAYNNAQLTLGREDAAVKKFSSRADGLKKLERVRTELVNMHGYTRLDNESLTWSITKPAPAAKAKVAKEKTPKAKAKAEKTSSGPATKLDMARRFELVKPGNPKRAGSMSHGIFSLYQNGMSGEEFIAAMISAGHTRRLAILNLNWDVAHGFIRFL